jgi:hypothetical protein
MTSERLALVSNASIMSLNAPSTERRTVVPENGFALSRTYVNDCMSWGAYGPPSWLNQVALKHAVYKGI